MFGALIAGCLGELIGLRATLAAGAIGIPLPFLRLLFSPLCSPATLNNSKINDEERR
jgi:hypothetical protein